MLLIHHGRVCTRDPENPWIEDGAVVTEGDTILAVGPRADLEGAYPEAERIDARGGLIMPGYINAHTHIYSGLARGLSVPGHNPTTFLEVLEGMWWNIDRHLSLEGTRASAWATCLECIRNGVTTIFDHHASYGAIRGSLFTIEEVVKQAGIRACLCYEVSQRDGPEKCAQAIAENADFARHCRQDPSPQMAAMFGGHALFTLSDATFEAMERANAGMTGYHIHVAEGMNDVYDSLRRYGCRPVNRLLYNGILGERTILGHCIHLSPAEMDILAETGTMVVNNPQSNMGNAVGCSPVLQMWERGILVGLGTDAYTHDMLESLKAALTIQRHNAMLPNVGWNEVTGMLFRNNALIAQKYFGPVLGVLKPGAAADVITVDYRPFTPLGPDNLDGHMIFGICGKDTRNTIAGGKVLYRDRQFVTLDEEAIDAFCLEQSRRLWGDLDARS